MELGKITSINIELGKRYNNVTSFREYIDITFNADTRHVSVYKERLQSELDIINNYLLSFFEQKITDKTLQHFLSRIQIIRKNIENIRINISNSLGDYEFHQGIPERFYERQMNEESKLGKTNSYILKKYNKFLEEDLSNYDAYDSFISTTASVFHETFNQLIKQFPNHVRQIKTQSPKNKKKNDSISHLKSFNYIKYLGIERMKKIISLFNHLKQNGLIDSKTTDKRFTNLFLCMPISKRVNWTGDKGKLGFFINELNKQGFLYDDDKNRIWEKTKACFLTDNEIINIKNLKTNCNPKDKKAIIEAINVLR